MKTSSHIKTVLWITVISLLFTYDASAGMSLANNDQLEENLPEKQGEESINHHQML